VIESIQRVIILASGAHRLGDFQDGFRLGCVRAPGELAEIVLRWVELLEHVGLHTLDRLPHLPLDSLLEVSDFGPRVRPAQGVAIEESMTKGM